MKRNLLAAVKANTSPVSSDEFQKLLVQRHGAHSKGNASADPSALDAVGRDALNLKKETILVIAYKPLQAPAAKRKGGQILKVKRHGKLGKEVIAAIGAKKKKVFGF